jgi:hypothetical protein
LTKTHKQNGLRQKPQAVGLLKVRLDD